MVKKILATFALFALVIACASCDYQPVRKAELVSGTANSEAFVESVGDESATVNDEVERAVVIERAYLPAPADASPNSCGENATWYIEDGTLYIDGEGAMWDYSLEDEAPWATNNDDINRIIVGDGINIIGSHAFAYLKKVESVELGKNVSIIGDAAFFGLDALCSIELPSNVVKIEDYAFEFCIYLRDVKFNDGLLYIGEGAFSLCYDLYEVDIPDSVTTIKRDAFNGCSDLRAVKLPNGIEKIGVWCFADSGLELVHIPKSLKFIATGVFDGCDSLKDVYFDGTFDEWSSVEIDNNNIPLENANVHFNS